MADRLLNICFHGIGVPGRALEHGEERYWIGVDQFHQILDEIAGWQQVRISFDDGNRSDLEQGLPALVDRGLSATFFVLAGRFGQPGSLTESDIRTLVQAGMTIGSHGMDHRSWRGLDSAERARELVQARDRISEVSGSAIDQVALPLGQYDRRLLASLRAHRYSRVFTSDRRAAGADSWLQPRFSVRADDSPAQLRESILGQPRKDSLSSMARSRLKRLR